jgi:hypothetical protein
MRPGGQVLQPQISQTAPGVTATGAATGWAVAHGPHKRTRQVDSRIDVGDNITAE